MTVDEIREELESLAAPDQSSKAILDLIESLLVALAGIRMAHDALTTLAPRSGRPRQSASPAGRARRHRPRAELKVITEERARFNGTGGGADA